MYRQYSMLLENITTESSFAVCAFSKILLKLKNLLLNEHLCLAKKFSNIVRLG